MHGNGHIISGMDAVMTEVCYLIDGWSYFVNINEQLHLKAMS